MNTLYKLVVICIKMILTMSKIINSGGEVPILVTTRNKNLQKAKKT